MHGSITRTTSFDKAASFLLTMLLLLGCAVGVMFGIWMTGSFWQTPPPVPIQIEPTQEYALLDDDAVFDPNVFDAGMDVLFDEPTSLESLQTHADMISSLSSLFSESTDWDDESLLSGGKKGDGRTSGSSAKRRWDFIFSDGITVEQYAAQLDHFGIELGVLLSGGRIQYATQLSAQTPAIRDGKTTDEHRYYMTWIQGGLQEADRALLDKASIENKDKIVLKFIPAQLEQKLVQLETERAGDRKDQVRGTVFGIRPTAPGGAGYEFFVLEQF